MEFFIRNVSAEIAEYDFRSFLGSLLIPDSIYTFDVRMTKKKGCAILTIADVAKAQQFFTRYDRDQGTSTFRSKGKPIFLSHSRNGPDPWLLKVLQKEEKDRLLRLQSIKKGRKQTAETQSKRSIPLNLNLRDLSCGRWESRQSGLVYVIFGKCDSSGVVSVNKRSLTIALEINDYSLAKFDVVVNFHDMHSISLKPMTGPTVVTITLGVAPKIYESCNADAIPPQNMDRPQDFAVMMKNLILDDPKQKPTRYRSSELGSFSAGIFELVLFANASDTLFGVLITDETRRKRSRMLATCLVYRFTAENGSEMLEEIKRKSMGTAPILQSSLLAGIPRHVKLDDQISQLQDDFASYQFPYSLKFQLQRLWANTYLSPHEIRGLLHSIALVREQSGDEVVQKVVRRLSSQIPYAGPEMEPATLGLQRLLKLINVAEKSLREVRCSHSEDAGSNKDAIPVHKVTVTPTGLYLEGPDEEASNRVLRRYSAHAEYFLRVSFLEEDGDRIFFDRESSNVKIFQRRFNLILRYGIYVDRHTTTGRFLAHSLPCEMCGKNRTSILSSHSATPIDPCYVKQLEEVEYGKYTFSDGVGTFSPKVWSLILGNSKSSTYQDPTLYQIRFGGAKGMISLNSHLEGYQLCLRPSMIKYEGSQSSEIEICGSALRPLPMRLNRQHIKILEDLGVAGLTFERLQQDAIQSLRAGTASSQNAVAFLQKNLADGASQLSWLLRKLNNLDIDATDDTFILDILGALIQIELRELKYRSRIPVKNAVTLYGIMDESRWLEEGQIHCTFNEGSRKIVLRGRVAVTRSPALHPGDVQLADAVSVPADSLLADIHNCVVFSAQGDRDLPSQLSGGDLDGDLYNVIYDLDLIPKNTFQPAEYSRPTPQDIGRSVTTCDMTDFFLDFMENDQLGRIATLHQILADRFPEDTKSPDCLNLAALHSTAVDFSKTGVPVDLKKIPRSPLYRPDFMAPGTSTKIEKGVVVHDLTNQNPDETEFGGYRYYESPNILGTLYRAIDEETFFEELEDDASSVFNKGSSDTVLEQIWDYVESTIPSVEWRPHLKEAMEIRDSYESHVIDSMFEFSIHRTHHLTEKEVFLGKIIGKKGVGTKRQREMAAVMKDRFERSVHEITAWIRGDNKALERAIACLFVGKDDRRDTSHRVDIVLLSFGWIAAAICLQEAEQL